MTRREHIRALSQRPLPSYCQPWLDIARPATAHDCEEFGHVFEGGECTVCGEVDLEAKMDALEPQGEW